MCRANYHWDVSSQDPIDHPHIKGVTVKGVEPLFEAGRAGAQFATAGCDQPARSADVLGARNDAEII